MRPGARPSVAPGEAHATPLYAFALLSGASALVYEVAWTKMLALTFGRTTLAASAVVGGFMVGMGIGAWLYHRAQGEGRSAIRIYAVLEVGIALSTALLTAALAALPPLFASMSGALGTGLGMTLFRIGFVVAILLPPAALMGATYPALCTVLIRSREDAARHLGPLYGLNTVGAALGALVAGFVLVEWLGLRGSVWTANALNLAIAAAAWALASRIPARTGELAGLEDARALVPTELPRRLTGLVLFGSGFATLAYEIVWFRALRYLFGSSTYAFSLMLAVFLLGLGLGALLCGERRQAAAERNLALSQLGVAVLALAAIALETLVLQTRELESALSIFSRAVYELPWWQRLATDLVVAVVLLLPATLLMGFSFPLATRLYLADVRVLGRRVGGAYLLANLGSITGAVAAAVWILPRLGTVAGTRAIASVSLLLGLLVLGRLRWSAARTLAVAVPAVAVVWVTALVLPDRLPFRVSETIASQRMDLVYEEEGDLATVQVWAAADDPGRRTLTVDGTPIGESRGLRKTIYAKQVLLAHLPMALDPDIRRTLNVGLGSGSTLASLASYPGVDVLDVVEISGGVVRGSRLFEESRVLDDPRTGLFVEDAAHFLLQQRPPYDLIVSDGKLGADFSGNAMMLCRDFYEAARAQLSERGIFVQWIPLSHASDDFDTIVRTFLASFPEVELFFQHPASVHLFGSRAPLPGRAGGAEALGSALAGDELAFLGIGGRAALLSHWAAGGPALRRAFGDGPSSTWNHSRLEYSIYRTRRSDRQRSMAPNLARILEAEAGAGANPFLPEDSPFAASARLSRAARLEALRGRPVRARVLAERAVAANGDDLQARAILEEMRGKEEAVRRRKALGDERGGRP